MISQQWMSPFLTSHIKLQVTFLCSLGPSHHPAVLHGTPGCHSCHKSKGWLRQRLTQWVGVHNWEVAGHRSVLKRLKDRGGRGQLAVWLNCLKQDLWQKQRGNRLAFPATAYHETLPGSPIDYDGEDHGLGNWEHFECECCSHTAYVILISHLLWTNTGIAPFSLGQHRV